MVDKVSLKDICFGAKLVNSLKNTGFAIITDHDIHEDFLNNFYESWKSFFDNDDLKNQYLKRPFHSGYFPIKSEKAKDAKIADLKEFFHYYPTRIDDPSGEMAQVLYVELNEMASMILREIENNLPKEVKNNFSMPLSQTINFSQQTLLRVIHYPPIKNAEPGAVRAAAHEDINLITILPAATEMGLEVKDSSGKWVAVEAEPHSMVVNVGDMLQEMTGSYLRSTSHRVVNVGMDKSRFSAPLFLHPNPEVILSKKYTADSYLKERLKELGLL